MQNPISKIRNKREALEEINRDYLEEKNNIEAKTPTQLEYVSGCKTLSAGEMTSI